MKKTKFTTIALIIALTVSAIFVAFPLVTAHDPPWSIPTYAYVSASPRTVGVGEYTLIVFWLDKYPPTAAGIGGDRWRGHMIEITKPDGSKEQLGPFTSGPVGSGWTTYTPDQVGDYTIVHSWPGQILTNGTITIASVGLPYVGDYFEASESEPTTLTVTTEPAEQWQEPPVTTDYWTRPIYSANRNWAQLPSNWLKGSWLVDDFQRWGKAPNTGHIMWAKPIIDGGIPDAAWGAQHGQTTDYENFFGDPIIMNGKIYYNTGMHPEYGYYCVDLQTGEQIWYKNGTDNGLGAMPRIGSYGFGGGSIPGTAILYPSLSFGQLYHYYSINGQGVLSYLWMTVGSNWYMFDANTGNWIMTLTNVPGGTTITDQDGSILRYSYNRRTGNFLAWNTSQSIPPPGVISSSQQQWEPPVGTIIDAVNDTTFTEIGPDPTGSYPYFEDDILPRSGYTMNVTGPTGLPGSISVLQDENRVPRMIFGSSFESSRWGTTNLSQEFQAWAVRIDENVVPMSPFPDKTPSHNNNLGYGVTLLWNKTISFPLGGDLSFSLGARSYEDGVFVLECKETRQKWGYSLETGDQLWGPTAPEDPWNMYGQSNNVAYGNLYGVGYGGRMYCYDIKTGQLKWTYEAKGIGYESPYGDYPLSIGAIADGKVYLYSTEHSPTTPLWRGSYLRCVDAYTGEEMWKSLDFVSGFGLADGYVVTGDWYDQRMYCYGKGPSATTVSIQDDVITEGEGVLIKGTVTDQSAGAKGTPAIADEYMDAWMEYLYKQQAKPTDAVGVTVKLSSYDPNGNYQDIGTTTVDLHGNFGKSWIPPVPGEYYVLAEFEGSESYGSSSATTYFVVYPASSAAQILEPETTEPEPIKPTSTMFEPTEPEPTEAIEAPLISIEVATVLAVVVVIGIIAFWGLRKQRK